MARLMTLCYMAILGLAAACTASEADEPSQADTSEQEIRKVEADFEKAVVKGDVEFFDRVLAQDFTHVTQSGKLRTRREWLANHKAGQSPYDALNVDQLSVRVYDNTAVVTAQISPTGKTSEGKPIEGQYRFIRVWVKQAGKWQAVAFQSTRVSPDERK
jgi:uncharacterized protein (TIGR02246 family)